VILLVPQGPEEIGARRPLVVVARAPLKLTVPKSVSGSVRQELSAEHADGASTIHSAERTSTAEAIKRFENDRWRVASVSLSVTRWPTTVTLALIASPGLIVIRIGRLESGTSSYQASEVTAPELEQSSSVPIYSSAVELRL
jgi:hypothetical protein